MRTIFLILSLIVFAPWANAETPMSAAEFDAYTHGKTFFFGNQGQPYGAEEYLDDRRVRWSFLGGECQDGFWYPEGEMICFVYDNQPDPQCWSFTRSAAGLIAQFQNDPTQTELYEVEKSHEPLICPGPDVGV